MATTIDQLMTPDPTVCTPDTPVAEVARLMVGEDCSLILIVSSEEERRLVGVVTDRDLVVRVMAAGLDPQTTMAEAVMTRDPVKAEPDEDVSAGARKMADAQIRRLVIVEHGGRLAGILAQADLGVTAKGRRPTRGGCGRRCGSTLLSSSHSSRGPGGRLRLLPPLGTG